jgi:hypothetical protein
MSTINFEKAIAYVKSLPTVPDSNLTPDVIIKWDKTKSFRTEYGGKIVEKSPVFYYPKTGKVEFLERAPANYKYNYLFDNCEDMKFPCKANKKISVTSAKKEIFSYYGKYHKEIDALEIASVVMKGNRAKDGEKRTWEYVNINNERYFLFKNGEAIKGFSYLQKDGKFYDKTLRHWLHSDIPQNIHNRYFDEQALVFFGFKAIEEWLNYEIFWIPFRVGNWYEKVAERPMKENSVKKALMESEELVDFSNEYLFSLFKVSDRGASICIPYKDGVLVRYYERGPYTSQVVGYKEKYRFFFNEKEEFILQKRGDKWSSCAANNCYQSCTAEHIVNFSELRKVKRIDRCVDTLLNNEFLNKNRFIINLIYTLKYPIVEKLGKAGYKYLMSKMIWSPTTLLRNKFGTTSKKTGTLYENLGMNKIQLKMLEQLRDPYKNTLPNIKFIKQIGGNDIIHWDEKKSQKIFKFAYIARSWGGLVLKENYLGAPEYLRWNREIKEFIPTEQDRKNLKNLINLQDKNHDVDVVRLFRDTVYTMCDRVHEILPNMNPFDAKTLRELQWMHDQYTNIANAQRYNNLKKDGRWDKFNKKRIEKYEKIGDEFEIIVPREPKDIINEGASLSHCVGGYLESVASGYKTILFLRKISDPDKSFYTIEVNDSHIVQIHGNHNRWLGNNPEAIQFVIDWLKDVQVRCSLRILFNLGQGYSGSNDNLDHSSYKLNEFVMA